MGSQYSIVMGGVTSYNWFKTTALTGTLHYHNSLPKRAMVFLQQTTQVQSRNKAQKMLDK